MKLQTLQKRLASEGILRTGWYAFGGTVLPKLGVVVKLLFELPPGTKLVAKAPPGYRLAIVRRLSDLTVGDLANLVAFEAPELAKKFETEFAHGAYCAIARPLDGGLVSASWITPDPPHLSVPGERTFMFHDAFTLPEDRGKGLFVATIELSYEVLREEFGDALPHIMCAAVFTNRASLRVIARCRFRRVGFSVRIGPWTWVTFKRGRNRILRRMRV